MEFREFVETVTGTIKNYLPKEYEDANICIYQFDKINGSYLGMVVRAEGQMISPTLNLNMFYNQLQSSRFNFEEIMKQMADIVQIPSIDINAETLTDFNETKNRLFIRVSDVDRNQEMLSHVPHTIIEDLAITYHIFIGRTANDFASSIITNEMMEQFNISKDQLHRYALENSPKLFPVKVIDNIMEKFARSELEAAGLNEEDIDQIMEEICQNIPVPLTVVSNEQIINGAAVLFYPGQMDKIGELLNGSYYILPSSVHEMLVVPDNTEIMSHELKKMVVEVNCSEVQPEDKLTDEVYHYDMKNKIFEKASAFEERNKTMY